MAKKYQSLNLEVLIQIAINNPLKMTQYLPSCSVRGGNQIPFNTLVRWNTIFLGGTLEQKSIKKRF